MSLHEQPSLDFESQNEAQEKRDRATRRLVEWGERHDVEVSEADLAPFSIERLDEALREALAGVRPRLVDAIVENRNRLRLRNLQRRVLRPKPNNADFRMKAANDVPDGDE